VPWPIRFILKTMYKKLISYLIKERLDLAIRKEQRGQHWCRVVMDEATRDMISEIPCKDLDALEISGDKWSNFGFKSYHNLQYPEFDICFNKLDDKFDIIIAEQVFEHLLWPYRAGKNVYDMIKPGGYFLVTTPFLLRIHPHPNDCSRWTETGIKYLLAECGFNIEGIKTGSWGNLECTVSNFNRWTVYRKHFHSLTNDPQLPIVVWALAKKG